MSEGPVAGRLAGKVAVITGAGAGQGREIALLFARAGAKVAGCDVDTASIEETRALAGKEGLDLDLSVQDATDPAQMAAWIDGVAARHGGIDILYNNAGSARFAPFADMSLDDWHYTLKLELDIVFVPTQAAWRHLVARGGGSIINIGSIAGMRGAQVVQGFGNSAHATGKGGIIGLTPQLAAEGAPYGIRVNTISPGPIVTQASSAVIESNPAFRELFEGMTPLGRTGDPVDVAYAGLFLASDESRFVTGINLPVDGGATCRVGVAMKC
ncbi:SDR family NAD(P)-dependent oxidoreductase [Novosphingobium beihaiensis]|uniref:SDR family oxidoreductase n=1 Tax=Novosphingobium beihaiensis TaxID=2930389 RepID=A0ABT0BTS6_9SPHN|nr:SDR family NAD(P)-dependent oxidoreductase [Novosphingobium beihaiensis]MCJ2188441.1 SDR family oxidoreductase [Novosphingobium beihaiensis]